MIKRICAALLIMALLLTAAACAETISSEVWLPSEVETFFLKEKLGGYNVTSFAENLGKSSNYAFALLQNAKGKNVLYVFKQGSKGWSYQYKTSAAVPQGTSRTVVEGNPGANHFSIAQSSGEKYARYEFRGGSWHLAAYYDVTRKMNVELTETRLAYYTGDKLDVFSGYVYGTVQTDLRYVGLSSIPSTLKEAKNKYTLAPAIPGGTLAAQVIKFSGGKLYPVYSGPGESYIRSANGKASVSTNDWIQVFGREGDWILVQYAIDASRYRFGYISASSLPGGAQVPYLAFYEMSSWTARTTALTDDPLFSQSTLLNLPADTPVVWLATMGEWAYVEVPQYNAARGFIPLSDIDGDWELDEFGTPYYGDTVG